MRRHFAHQETKAHPPRQPADRAEPQHRAGRRRRLSQYEFFAFDLGVRVIRQGVKRGILGGELARLGRAVITAVLTNIKRAVLAARAMASTAFNPSTLIDQDRCRTRRRGPADDGGKMHNGVHIPYRSPEGCPVTHVAAYQLKSLVTIERKQGLSAIDQLVDSGRKYLPAPRVIFRLKII